MAVPIRRFSVCTELLQEVGVHSSTPHEDAIAGDQLLLLGVDRDTTGSTVIPEAPDSKQVPENSTRQALPVQFFAATDP